jgi:EAL domain-containing protein (putative c-di-GMP-specific phosphodiesterase class I)
MLKEKKDLGIVTAIINMAHNLQLSAIVEGVENIQQLSLLEAQQAYLMQGYLFSPPVSAADCACLFAPPFLVDHLHQLAIPDKVNSLSSQGRVLEAG